MAGLYTKNEGDIVVVSIDNLANGQSFGLEEAIALEKILRKKPKGLIWTNQKISSQRSPLRSPWCSGGNLKYYSSLKSRLQGLRANRKIAAALDKLAKYQAPKVALLDGDVFGGGLELLSCFDHVIAAPHVFLGLWQRRIALTFGWGGGRRLERRLGQNRMIKLAMDARSLSALEAHREGLVDEIISFGGEARAIQYIKRQQELPQVPIEPLMNWSSRAEQKIFEKIWLNPEHKKILKGFIKSR